MTDPDQSPSTPDWSPPPQPPAPPATGRWKWIVPLIVVLIVGVGVGGYLAVGAFSDFTLTGRLVVNEKTCTSRGYQDISEGAQVQVVSQSNEVLGVGVLTREWSERLCTYRFTIPDVPSGERLYGVRMGNSNRGTLWKTEDDARRGVEMTLGS